MCEHLTSLGSTFFCLDNLTFRQPPGTNFAVATANQWNVSHTSVMPAAADHHYSTNQLLERLPTGPCLLISQAPVQAEELSFTFPASSNAEIRRAQQTMVESWAYVQALYLDPSFSHTDWKQALQVSAKRLQTCT